MKIRIPTTQLKKKTPAELKPSVHPSVIKAPFFPPFLLSNHSPRFGDYQSQAFIYTFTAYVCVFKQYIPLHYMF